VDEVALIQDTLSYYAPVLIAPLSNSSRPACRDFFLGPRKGYGQEPDLSYPGGHAQATSQLCRLNRKAAHEHCEGF